MGGILMGKLIVQAAKIKEYKEIIASLMEIKRKLC
jgi:hypothetical protein